jgi:hypothetical protein
MQTPMILYGSTVWLLQINNIRVHSRSLNCRFLDLYECGSQLATESSNGISCEFEVNCGCTVIAHCTSTLPVSYLAIFRSWIV